MCAQCGDKGLLRVMYESGEPFDVAFCPCPLGRRWRKGGVELVRMRLSVGEEHHVGELSDFDEEVLVAPDVTAAGRKPQKAKL
jgi:hypothetical protein